MTFAPLVIACSACCCWVDLSFSAFSIVLCTPAASNAFFRSGRSTVSHRTEDFESGSSTATFPALALLLPPPPLDDELLSLLSLPQAATNRAPVAHTAKTDIHALLRMNLPSSSWDTNLHDPDAPPTASRVGNALSASDTT